MSLSIVIALPASAKIFGNYFLVFGKCGVTPPRLCRGSLALKIIKQLQNNNVSLWFYNLGKNKSLRIAVYVDPSLANSSIRGYLFFIVGENRKCSLLHWQSKRIKRVVLNSLSAETLALCDALDDAIILQQRISELLFNETFSIPIDIYTDIRSLYDILKFINHGI